MSSANSGPAVLATIPRWSIRLPTALLHVILDHAMRRLFKSKPPLLRARLDLGQTSCALAVVTAVGAIHAGEPVVRIAALEEALDDALFEQPLQASFGSQFR